MLFWIICGVLALGVAGLIAAPLLRGAPEAGDTRTEVALYRAQLAEIDRDIARGVLSGEEAERTRVEVARRLLAADAAAPQVAGEAPRGATLAVAVVCVLLIAGGGGYLYTRLGGVTAGGPMPDQPRAARLAAAEELRATRPSQDEMMAEVLAETELPPLPDDIAATLERLRTAAEEAETDPGAWAELAWIELELRNYERAFAAQDRLEALLPPDSPASRRATVQRLDMMVRAAGSRVSPEAEALAHALLDEDPENLAATFYLGLLQYSTDRPDRAFALWRGIVNDGPADSRYVLFARDFIEDAAARAGIDYTLPAAAPALRGPTEEDMAAAADMDPEAQQAMIRNMVQGLSDRLAAQGGTAEEWAQLISALGVLGEEDRAAAILAEAREVFAGQDEALATIEAAGASLP